jgi:HAD superfamily hydrolase (TIGR01509 family)
VRKAVIFDLWETLIDWDEDAARRMVSRIEELVEPGFRERWYASPNRYIAPVRDVLSEAGVSQEVMEDVCAIRLDYVRHCLVPRPGAVDTLRELRRRGYLVGLITVCSQDVETLWPESDFEGLFDAEVFSSRVGLSKPDPRIYLHCCELLGVEPHEAVFVGDGANDELAGARRVGMEAILIHRPGEDPLWHEVREWAGPRVTSIPEVLDALDRVVSSDVEGEAHADHHHE